MNRAFSCFLLVVCLVHASSATPSPAPTPAPAPSKSATELLEPLQDYLEMMNVLSPLTAQVYVVTVGGAQTWNNSMTYCQNTFSFVMNTNCYLAELLTAQQIKALGNELVGNNWSVWVGAYWKPQSHGNNQWVWYHTGYQINSPNIWQVGFPLPLTNGGNWAATVNGFTTWGAALQNTYNPGAALYFACTCY